eukprot:CAMPEP_0181191004 /NCGR_PEP_ID=MMETSP1096-20121128/12499_1 /TAXON_ID=156174 ORGANISM="Chrysochromulina ericina, Strain CCMP281" /NCGR_SAMPLE_ID=MMETSP1096 /ASSEMBLY_ACC=CAM_ASM_000453 /LENGTH=139 /DNA_ID=CAMNT_0023280265 /DNA_START=1 /DNA_END=421 /DNA_ORIENTATION=-
MVASGTPTPVIMTKELTTVQDLQQMAKIIVVAKRDEDPDGIELGHFKMEGIKPAKVATQRVTVTFKLLNEQTLQCSASYREGNRTVHLTFRDRKPLAPNLRAEVSAGFDPVLVPRGISRTTRSLEIIGVGKASVGLLQG